MNFELADQSIQYTFNSEKYKDGKLARTLPNVKTDATPESLVKVTLIQKKNLIVDKGE